MSKQCQVCLTINHSAANHCSNCGNELPDKELLEEDKLRIELHVANTTIHGLNIALAEMQKFREMYEESQKNATLQKDKLNQEIQKNKRLIEITKSTSPQIKNNEFFEKNIIPKPKKNKWGKWIFPSLFVIMMMIMISIIIVFNHRDNLNLGTVKNYEVKLYGDSAYQYSGEIKDNLPNGQGKANYKDKRNYEGTFCEGLRHGKGKMVFPDQATTYNGDYVHGIAEGQGKMHYSNGHYYIGKWKNNKQNGLGTYYDSNGNELYHGLWKNGKPIDKKR